ncbi:uncharacterized protein K441DRAFT_652190 [Cenococcum geophilum 1.58]|uniref:uncharacterized protein n=1 Tax=Cenococcum geophilum 1.58 TaxID=794803 RepID=UPI00358DED6D|nr:hypothetical protein K441DRAFT_652190 [Cenococcum geophilum 1.58]
MSSLNRLQTSSITLQQPLPRTFTKSAVSITPTSRGNPLVPLAANNLESQAPEPQSEKYEHGIPKYLVPQGWSNDEHQLDGLVDCFGFEYFGFEPRLVKPLLTDNTGKFLVEYKGRYYFANLIIVSLYRSDEPKDLDSILSIIRQKKIQNIRKTQIVELDDTDD